MTRISNLFMPLLGTLLSVQAGAQSEPQTQKVDAIEIQTSRNSQLGTADSANSGIVTQKQLEARTVYRPGELLEATPD